MTFSSSCPFCSGLPLPKCHVQRVLFITAVGAGLQRQLRLYQARLCERNHKTSDLEYMSSTQGFKGVSRAPLHTAKIESVLQNGISELPSEG